MAFTWTEPWKGFESIDPAWETSSRGRGRGRRGRSAPPQQQQAPQQPAPQPSPQQQNTGYQDVSRRSLAPPIPIQGVGPALPSGTQFARGGPVRGTGYAEGGSVDDNDSRTDDDDTVYASTAPAWTKGSYASALGLAGGAGEGYARGGPVEPAGTNFRRILAHNRRKFGLHEQQQRTGYAEGGSVEDENLDPNRDYIEPEQPVYDPERDRVEATPAVDHSEARPIDHSEARPLEHSEARPVEELDATTTTPSGYSDLTRRMFRFSHSRPPQTDSPPSADDNIVKLLGQAVQRGAEDVGSTVGRRVSEAGRSVADTASDVGRSITNKYGSMKERLAAYARGDNALPPEHTEQLIRDEEAANPNASHNDNLQSVFDNFMSQYKHDDAGKFIQSLRQPYDQARAVSQAALAHDNIDASLKAFEHAHNLLPNETNLQLERQPDGMIRANVAEHGEATNSILLTPQQYSDWIHSSGSQFDHVGDIGTRRSLGKATGPDGDTHTNRVAQGLEGVKNSGLMPYIGPQGEERTGPNTAVGRPAVPYSRAVDEALAVPHAPAPGSLFGAPHEVGDRLTSREIEGARTAPDRGALVRNPSLLAHLPEGYFDTLEGRAALERLVRTHNVPSTDPSLLADALLQITHPESLSSPEDWKRAYDATGGPLRSRFPTVYDEGGREVASESRSRSGKTVTYRDRPPSFFEDPRPKTLWEPETGSAPSPAPRATRAPTSTPRATAPARSYIGPQGEERTGPNTLVGPRRGAPAARGRHSELDDDTGAPAPTTGYAGTDVDDTQTLPPEIANARAQVPAATGYNTGLDQTAPPSRSWGTPAPPYPQRPQPQQRQTLPPPSGRPFTPNFNEGMNAPGSAAPAPFQAGPNDPLYNQPPSWPRPDQHGRATYPGGLRMSPTTDPRQQVLQGPNGETIAGFPANQSLSAEDAAAKYQSYNQRELEKRLYDGDPVAVAALTRRGPQDFSKPLPPPQPATPESMAAAKAEMVKRQMIRPDPPSEFEQRLARETNPATRTALINQQGLTQRAQATAQAKAQENALNQLSKDKQQVAITARTKYTNTMPLTKDEQAVLDLLAQHTAVEMQKLTGGQRGAAQQPHQAPQAGQPPGPPAPGKMWIHNPQTGAFMQWPP